MLGSASFFSLLLWKKKFVMDYLINASYILLFLFIFGLGKWIYNLTTSYNTFEQIIKHKNQALGLSISGYLVALTLIYLSALYGPSVEWSQDMLSVALYTSLGLVLLTLSRWINDKVILHGFCNKTQLIEHQNTATGMAQAASYLASGLVIAGAIKGEGNLMSALVFYALGQVLLIFCAFGYDKLTRFSLQDEMEKGNPAAAISFSATLIALSTLLYHALGGEFVSWQASIRDFLMEALLGALLLAVVRYVIDLILLPGVRIDKAIEEDQNQAVALIEATATISVALVILCSL